MDICYNVSEWICTDDKSLHRIIEYTEILSTKPLIKRTSYAGKYSLHGSLTSPEPPNQCLINYIKLGNGWLLIVDCGFLTNNCVADIYYYSLWSGVEFHSGPRNIANKRKVEDCAGRHQLLFVQGSGFQINYREIFVAWATTGILYLFEFCVRSFWESVGVLFVMEQHKVL